jgi:DNA-binding NtrC family response regulator
LKVPRLSREEARQLQEYDWPGNIRELENVIERATILSKSSGRFRFDLGAGIRERKPRPSSAGNQSGAAGRILTKEELRAQEVENIMAALKQSDGKVFGPGGAAEILGMRPTTLTSRLKALGLKKSFFPSDENG